MARKGNVFIFKNGAKCLVVENKVKKVILMKEESTAPGTTADGYWLI